MNAKNAKILVISIIIVIALASIGGLLTAFLLSYNGFRPNSPLILDDGKNIYISTELNDSYEKYRFKFIAKDQTIIIESENNTITKDEFISRGGRLGTTYKVSVCYVAKKEGNNSEYSKPTSWLCCSYLARPDTVVDEWTKTISWQSVENADFYRVFVNGTDEGHIDTEELNFNYSDLIGGQKTFSVVACSKKAGYKNSIPSVAINLNHVRILKGFSKMSFDGKTKTITAEAEEEYKVLRVILDSSETEVRNFECTKEGEIFIYKIDIKDFYNNENLIGLNAKSIDEYNISSNDNNAYVNLDLTGNN